MGHSPHRRATAVPGWLVCLLVLALAGCAGGVTESSAGGSSNMSSGSSAGQAAAPTIGGTPPTTAVVGSEYSFQPSAWDTAGDALSFSIQNQPAWATFDSTTGKLSGTPAAGDVGASAAITITVSDGALSAELTPFQIDVEPQAVTSGGSLKLSGSPPTTVQAGSHYVFQPSVSAPAGAKLTFSITHLPSWAAFNVQTGQLSGTPSTAAVGTYSSLTISVSDDQSTASLAPFSIQVQAASAPPAPPVISGKPATEIRAGKSYNFTPAAHDGSGIPLTFNIRNKPDWASFSAGTGEVRGTPANSAVGTYTNIVISVSDGHGSASLPAFNIKVMPASAPPAPPTISGSPGTEIQAGQPYSFTPVASDAAGNPLNFTVVNRPSWANFDAATGQLSGTPSAGDVGTTAGIVISVSDGSGRASLPAFSLQVTAAAPPTIGGTPGTQVQAGQNYSFTPTASGPNGATLTFSVQNRPAWASFNSANGQLSGTPDSSAVGSYADIVVGVSDGEASASLSPFTIQVTSGSGSPPPAVTISGTPATQVQAGQDYSFTPTASAPGGTSLTFSVQNLPGWARFSAANGQLSGSPSNAQAGTYGGIVISVSDGRTSASLPAFAILVNATAANPTVSLTANASSISSGSSATLSWSSTNATSCTASGGWSGSEATSGSASTGALSSTTTFTLTCNGASGTTAASASTTVSVQSGTAGGGVTRPPYNTGYGLFVLNGKLYDSKGIEFRIRGVNLCHYDSTQYSGPGIARSNANTVRVGFYLSSIATSAYVSAMQTYISDSENVVATIFYVPGTRNVTSGDQSTADLASVVQNWVQNFQYFSPLQQHLIIDIANEWGPANSTTWESAYISAIATLRAAGYTAPIMIDTGGWGQDINDLLNYATAVFNSDPQKNAIFSLHVYAGLGSPWTPTSLSAYAKQLKALADSAGMVFVFGEFGPGNDIGPSPTMMTPQQVIGAAEGGELGWMGWAWDDNNESGGASSNDSFSMTFHGPGIYTVPSDLTTYGQEMVLSSYALKLARNATDF